MALTTDTHNAPKLGSQPIQASLSIAVKAAARCRRFGIAVIDAGYARPGYEATGLIAAGWFDGNYDNTTGADGAISASIVPGCRKVANSADADELTQADVGKVPFIVDDNRVARTSGGSTRSAGGRVIAVEPDGVWVQFVLV